MEIDMAKATSILSKHIEPPSMDEASAMNGSISSLNASAAAAILLYEAVRQRSAE